MNSILEIFAYPGWEDSLFPLLKNLYFVSKSMIHSFLPAPHPIHQIIFKLERPGFLHLTPLSLLPQA